MENSCKWRRTTCVVVCIVSAALVCYVFYNPQPTINNLPEVRSPTNESTDTPIQNITAPIIKKIKPPKPRYPHCEKKHLETILLIILEDYALKRSTCDENDCQINTDDQGKTKERGLIVVYAAVALLLVSLIAAFLEVYKARKVATVVTREKPELSRRCSLADLTVLRHNRRASMLRQMSVDAAPNQRVPLKLLGKSLSIDNRPSSVTPLPTIPVKKKWQRSLSADDPGPTEHRIHIIRHH